MNQEIENDDRVKVHKNWFDGSFVSSKFRNYVHDVVEAVDYDLLVVIDFHDDGDVTVFTFVLTLAFKVVVDVDVFKRRFELHKV